MSARWRTGLVVLGAALALAGCSSGGSDAPEDGTASSGSAVQEQAPEQAPEEEVAEDSGALDAFVAEQQAAIPAVMDASPGTYSEVRIEGVAPSTIVFTYVYAEAVDAAAAAEYLDGMVETLQAACDSQVFPAMTDAGLTGPQATYTYLNPDGSEIWTHTFTS